MKPTTLSKSRFRVGLECPRKLTYLADPAYANQRSDDDLLEALAEGGFQVGALAKLMHPGGIEISARALEQQIAETDALLREGNVTLFEPTFRHGNLVARVDVLIKRGTRLDLIEVKAKGFDPKQDAFLGQRGGIAGEWQPYLCDVTFQLLVLGRAHPEWTVTPHLMLLDISARASVEGVGAQFSVERTGAQVVVRVRDGFDPASLREPLLRAHDVTELVAQLRRQPVKTPAGPRGFEEVVDWLGRATAAGEDLPPFPGAQCKTCEFYCEPAEMAPGCRSGWAECMSHLQGGPVTQPRSATVFGLHRHRGIGALLTSGHLLLADLDEESLPLTDRAGEISPSRRHRLQRDEAKGLLDAPVLARDALRMALPARHFPLHFIDFETARPPLPFHAGHRPYQLVLFQFSHHVLGSDGHLRHADQCLIARPGVDPSIDVVRALRAALSGDEGAVVHWWDHERNVLGELGRRIAASDVADRDELTVFIGALTGGGAVQGRLMDLGRLVARTAFFPGTSGRSSIKKVLPAVLARSAMLQRRYGVPVYGTSAMPSLNYHGGWCWLQQDADGRLRDPYALLDPLLDDAQLAHAVAQGEAEETGQDSFIANGGAAMVAYGVLQQPDLALAERDRLERQLKRYCELDTLAMVMVYEALQDWVG